MNKKFLGIFAALVVLGSTGAFASAALGLQAGGNVNGNGFTPGLALTFKTSSLPCVFALDGYLQGDTFGLGVTADWWMANPRLAGLLHFFYGPGVAAAFNVFNGSLNNMYAAGRFVLGLNIFLADPFELYLQAAGQLGVNVPFNGGNAGLYWSVPVALGFRFWF